MSECRMTLPILKRYRFPSFQFDGVVTWAINYVVMNLCKSSAQCIISLARGERLMAPDRLLARRLSLTP